MVDIQQPHAVVASFFVPKWLSVQQVFVQPVECLAEREKLHLLAVFGHGMINQFDDLVVPDPTVRVENQVQYALFDNRDIDRHLQVEDGLRSAFFLVVMLGRPVGGGGVDCGGNISSNSVPAFAMSVCVWRPQRLLPPTNVFLNLFVAPILVV